MGLGPPKPLSTQLHAAKMLLHKDRSWSAALAVGPPGSESGVRAPLMGDASLPRTSYASTAPLTSFLLRDVMIGAPPSVAIASGRGCAGEG